MSSSSTPPFPPVYLFPEGETPSPASRVHVAVSTAIYYVPSTEGSTNSPPQALTDFSGAKRLYLPRLPQGTQEDAAKAAVAPIDTAGPGFALRVHCATRKKETCASAFYVLVAPSEEVRELWMSVVRMSIWPMELVKDELLSAVRTASTGIGGGVPSAGATGSAEEPLGESRVGRGAGVAAKVANWSSATVQGIAGAADFADAAARSLGGVSLVGPALQLVALTANCARMVEAANANRDAVQNFHGRLVQSAERLETVAGVLLDGEAEREGFGEFVGDFFVTFLICWEALGRVEGHLLGNWARRVWEADEVVELEEEVVRVENSVRQERLVEALCRLDRRQEAARAEFREGLGRVQESIGELAVLAAPGEDAFRATMATLDPLPPHVLEAGSPKLELVKKAVLCHSSVAVTAAAHGEGGLGKTTACLLIGHDPKVKQRFRDGVYFLPLGPLSDDASVVDSLAYIVSQSGGRKLAVEMRQLEGGDQKVSRAVQYARAWFEGRQVLIIADNLWPRSGTGFGRPEWAPALSPIASGEGSVFLFSTREKQLARDAKSQVEFDRLDMSVPADEKAASLIFEEYAGISEARASAKPGEDERFSTQDSVYTDARNRILALCGGWPMALEAAGALVRNYAADTFAPSYEWRWDEILDLFGDRLAVADGARGQGGLRATWGCSLKFVETRSAEAWGGSNEHFERLGVHRLRQQCGGGSRWFSQRFASLCIYEAQREVPVPVLAVHFGVSVEDAQAFAELCEAFHLGKVSTTSPTGDAGSGADVLTSKFLALHDLQRDFASYLTRSDDVGAEGAVDENRQLVSRCISAIGQSVEQAGELDWTGVYYEDFGLQPAARLYFETNLVSHLCGCVNYGGSGRAGAGGDAVVDANDGVWLDRVCQLASDYRWIRSCGAVRGRAAMLGDWETITKVFRKPRGGDFPKHKLLSEGKQHALLTIYEVLESVSAEHFWGDFVFETGGGCDRGLAAQLYGRLVVLQFAVLGAEDREEAEAMRDSLLASIDTYANGPWLRPRNECFGSIERKDSRCLEVFRGGEGVINGLEFVTLAGRRLIVSGCWDGNVRVHDLDARGECVCELNGHDDNVTGVSVARSLDHEGCIQIASCSIDRTVRLWRVLTPSEATAKGLEGGERDLKGVSTLEWTCIDRLAATNGELLWRIDMARGGERIVSGGVGKLESAALGEDEQSGGGDGGDWFGVHVWTRTKESGAGGGSGGDVAGSVGGAGDLGEQVSGTFSCILLRGHTDRVWTVQVSRDGELVVSGSLDRTARVWRVPMDAGDAGDAELLHVLDAASTTLNPCDSQIYSAVLTADARTLYTGTEGCGVRIWDVREGKLVGSLLPDGHDAKKKAAAVTSLALVEDGEEEEEEEEERGWTGGGGVAMDAAGRAESSQEGQKGLAEERIRRRLICGLDDGTISEWDATLHSLVDTYGYARAGVGLVRSLAARKVGGGHLSGGGAASVERSGGAGEGSNSEIAGASRIEVVSGYLDGRVRVWEMGSGAHRDGQTPHAAAAVETAAAVGGDSAGDGVDCICASPDGRMIACGRESGDVELWSVETGRRFHVLPVDERTFDIDFNDRCDQVACGGEGGAVSLWEVESGRRVRVFETDGFYANCVLFAANSSYVVAGYGNGVVKVWQRSSGKLVWMRSHENDQEEIGALAVSVYTKDTGMHNDRGDGPSGGRDSGSGGGRRKLLGKVFCCGSSRRRAAPVASNTAQADSNDTLTEPVVVSRDEGGRCRAWGLVSGTEVGSAEGSGAGRVVVDALGEDSVVAAVSSWREKQCWFVGRPKEREFYLKGSGRSGRSDAARVFLNTDENNNFLLEARIAHSGPNEARGDCVASIEFESIFWEASIECFIGCKEGNESNRSDSAIVFVGLLDGNIAMVDLVE